MGASVNAKMCSSEGVKSRSSANCKNHPTAPQHFKKAVMDKRDEWKEKPKIRTLSESNSTPLGSRREKRQKTAHKGSEILSSHEMKQWEETFDKILLIKNTSEDDLPTLQDLPELEQTNISATPHGQTTDPSTPASSNNDASSPLSRYSSKPGNVIVIDSDNEEDSQFLMSGGLGEALADVHLSAPNDSPRTDPSASNTPASRISASFSPGSRPAIPGAHNTVRLGKPGGVYVRSVAVYNARLPPNSRLRLPKGSELWTKARMRARNRRIRYFEFHPSEGWVVRPNYESHEGETGESVRVTGGAVVDIVEYGYDDDEYDVQRVVGEKRGAGTHHFLLEWVGYEELDWIPARDCYCPELIDDFRAVQRANLLQARASSNFAEVATIQQLTDAADSAAVEGKPPNPSRHRLRDKRGRFAKLIAIDDEGSGGLELMSLAATEAPTIDEENLDDHHDNDYGSRQRVHRSNTAMRRTTESHQSVSRDTPQIAGKGEVLWVRSWSAASNTPSLSINDVRSTPRILPCNKISGPEQSEEDSSDINDASDAGDIIDLSAVERETIEWRSGWANNSGPEHYTQQLKQQNQRLAETITRAGLRTKKQRRDAELIETVRRAAHPRHEDEEGENEEEENRIQVEKVTEEKAKQKKMVPQQNPPQKHHPETTRQGHRGWKNRKHQWRPAQRSNNANNLNASIMYGSPTTKVVTSLTRNIVNGNGTKQQRRGSRKARVQQKQGIRARQNYQLSSSFVNNPTKVPQKPIESRVNRAIGKQGSKRPPSQPRSMRIQNRLMQASIQAAEKARRRGDMPHSFRPFKKHRQYRSDTSMRRSEQGDDLRMARYRERITNAPPPTRVRHEFAATMDRRQHDALLRRPFGPGLSSSDIPWPSIEI